jgi:hypothetical protein
MKFGKTYCTLCAVLLASVPNVVMASALAADASNADGATPN